MNNMTIYLKNIMCTYMCIAIKGVMYYNVQWLLMVGLEVIS